MFDYSALTPFNNADYYHPYCLITDWNNETDAQICQTGDNQTALPDLYTEHEEVQNMLIKYVKNLIDKYAFDGLRIDAAKHVTPSFLPNLAKGIDNMFMTGEVLVGDIPTFSDYQRNYIGSLPNYPVYFQMKNALLLGNTTVLANEIENMKTACPDVNALVSFSENHDNPRIPSLKKDMVVCLSTSPNNATY